MSPWLDEDLERENMNPRASLWLKTVYARTWVRTKSIYGEPIWVAVNVGFPFFTSLALSLLYSSAGLKAGIGFAFLGGVMVSFWGNVLWSMASQFNWGKQQGLFELYVTTFPGVCQLTGGKATSIRYPRTLGLMWKR